MANSNCLCKIYINFLIAMLSKIRGKQKFILIIHTLKPIHITIIIYTRVSKFSMPVLEIYNIYNVNYKLTVYWQ